MRINLGSINFRAALVDNQSQFMRVIFAKYWFYFICSFLKKIYFGINLFLDLNT